MDLGRWNIANNFVHIKENLQGMKLIPQLEEYGSGIVKDFWEF